MPRPASNPPNPHERFHLERFEPELARLEVSEEQARSALAQNDSPDIPFRWSVNPYRGCQHACAYCYARPTHQYLGLGAGTDFDRRIVVKTNVAERLAHELARPGWRGEPITFSGVTDPYQPLEARYGLTRRCLEVALARRNPVAIITKSALVRRDVDLLAELVRRADARVFLSIPFADPEMARAIEPGTPTPAERFETLRALSDAGIPTGIALAPIVPRLNDADLPAQLERARAAGARAAFFLLLRLPAEVLDVFRERLVEAYPERAEAVLAALAEMRGGKLRESRFGERMRGHGPRYQLLEDLFRLHCRRLGLETGGDERLATTQPRARGGQGLLFEPGP
ncbi:MAG TPA: PA0069 family radical SAM protein [Planctomycetota bacterium]